MPYVVQIQLLFKKEGKPSFHGSMPHFIKIYKSIFFIFYKYFIFIWVLLHIKVIYKDSHTLLVRVQVDTITLDDNSAISPKAKRSHPQCDHDLSTHIYPDK